jgi:glycosyltransferase involved in cell wall biosynthesis
MPIEPSAAAADFPLVSVVTPSYNQGRFIAATIESVLSQDYPNVEYIIVDGASPDDTADVVARYAGRLTFVSEPDRGQSEAINKGLRRARGEYVAWLNSDDLFLPGAIAEAVAALRAHPEAGAVYGEGYQIDAAGKVISRFEVTQHFDLWKLLNVSDYILQQTVFFRRSIFDEIGWLDEELHYGLDWDLLMRIGLRYPIVYVPHYMGAIREYPAAKSFTGGAQRARELTRIMRRHTGKQFPPGMFVYGMPTYVATINTCVAWAIRGPLAAFGRRLQRRVAAVGNRIVGAIVRHAQGWYSDGWASSRADFAFRPCAGRRLALDVTLPPWAPFERQRLTFSIAGRTFATESFGRGEFRIPVMLPRTVWDRPVTVRVRAEFSFRPGTDAAGLRDRRKLAYLLRSFDYEDDGWA